jgi:hypothetical protein
VTRPPAETRLRRFMAESDFPPDETEAGNLIRDALNEARRDEKIHGYLEGRLAVWDEISEWVATNRSVAERQVNRDG